MDLYYDDLEELKENLECEKKTWNEARWDDELVEDFSRWLNRAAKTVIIALGVVSAAVVIPFL